MSDADLNNLSLDELRSALRQKDEEIAASKAKIEAQTQVIDDQAKVISAQKAFIDRLIEQTKYHGQRIKEFEKRMAIQEERASQLEQQADELAEQVEWIRRRIFVVNDDLRPDDLFC